LPINGTRLILKVIENYRAGTAELDREQNEAEFKAASEFNAELAERSNPFLMTEDQRCRYYELLNLSGSGEMGYIEIPSINVSLPIYHSTDESALQNGVGHLEWSSLPVGGESTHCVLSGHRGLPSAKLFTNLDSVIRGDIFVIHVLNEELFYEVDQIITVEPEDTAALQIEDGKDLCTLVTCTPYGINTHRLLIRGHRIETPERSKELHISSDAVRIEPIIVAPLLALPILIILIFWLFASDKRQNRKRWK